MADLIGQRLAGNIVYIDKSAHRRRIIDAIGPDVIKVIERFNRPLISAADTVLDWTTTLVEAGAGESTITKPDGVDGGLLFTTDANEDDGINFQMKGEPFKVNTSCRL